MGNAPAQVEAYHSFRVTTFHGPLANRRQVMNRPVIEIDPMIMLQLMMLAVERPITPPEIKTSTEIGMPFNIHKDTIKLKSSKNMEGVYYIQF
jgi:hypothetical protein